MDFMKAMYVLWPDYDYIDKAIDAGINTLFFAMYNPRPDISQKTEFGTYEFVLASMKHYKEKNNVKVILMPSWWQPWYPLPKEHCFISEHKFYLKTPCPTDSYHIDWIMEYPLKLYKEGLCDGLFWDFEDYGSHKDPERLKYFDDWNKDKYRCMCHRCIGFDEKDQRDILYEKIWGKLDAAKVKINGEYTYTDPLMWGAFPQEQWWVNAYTYKDWSVFNRIWKYTFPNHWFHNTKIENITCGQWLEHFTAKESLDHLRKMGRSTSVDGYWLYPQMRMSKNCYWRLHPNESWVKNTLATLPHTSFIDSHEDDADPNYFTKLKELNKKIDKYRSSWWFNIKKYSINIIGG